jgi:hypothetical protein
MKKTYIAPEVELIKVGTVSMLAASLELKDDVMVDTSDGDQLGREDNYTPYRPNLWEQGW